MLRFILLIVLAATACQGRDRPEAACRASLPLLPHLGLEVHGRDLRDALGRSVLLRGINAGGRSKFPPFFPFPFRESGRSEQADAPPYEEALAAYLDRVRDWGHNAVRLPFSWEAVEPERGRFDEGFLERYEAMVRAAAARGLRVIVDFHQDVFARPYCGDGFPLWACPTPLPPPPEDCSDWFLGYISGADVRAAFDRFWRNEDGLQDSFVTMWRLVSERARRAGAVAFEIINEPGWGTAIPEVWAKEVLTPFYSRVARAIREVAPGAPILFDATGLDAVVAETAVEVPEGGAMIFAPHYYDPLVVLEGRWTGERDLTADLGKWEAAGAAFGVPVLLGEFGIGQTVPGAPDYVRHHFDALDRLRMHGTLWEYSATREDWNREGFSIFGPDGEAETAIEAVRAYPRAVAGAVEEFRYDAGARAGVLRWSARADGVTEIAAPARLYPNGPRYELRGVSGCVAWEAGVLVVRTLECGPAALSFSP